jgi:hypothetical protein
MDVSTTIDAWRDFYGAVANAAAALLGLVFVGTSLHVTLRRSDEAFGLLALSSAAILVQPLLVSLAMLIPFGAPGVHAAGTFLFAAVTAIEMAMILRSRGGGGERSPAWLVYRDGVPFAACAVLAVGSIGMLAGYSVAVFAPALFVFAMFVVGVQESWDLVTGTRR